MYIHLLCIWIKEYVVRGAQFSEAGLNGALKVFRSCILVNEISSARL